MLINDEQLTCIQYGSYNYYTHQILIVSVTDPLIKNRFRCESTCFIFAGHAICRYLQVVANKCKHEIFCYQIHKDGLKFQIYECLNMD